MDALGETLGASGGGGMGASVPVDRILAAPSSEYIHSKNLYPAIPSMRRTYE